MIKLNLLPKNLRRRVEPGWWRLSAAIFTLLVLLIVGYLYFTVSSQLQAAENQRADLQAQVAQLQPYIQEQKNLQAQRVSLEKLLSVKKALEAQFIPWSQDLAMLIDQIPHSQSGFSIDLQSISTQVLSPQEAQSLAQAGHYGGRVVSVLFTLQGQAANQEALIQFIHAFENSPNFGLSFHQAQLVKDQGIYTFGATIGLVSPSTQEASHAR